MRDLERAGASVRESPFVPPTSLDVLGRRADSLRRRRHATIGTAIGLIVVVAIGSAAIAVGSRGENATTVVGRGPQGGTSAPTSEPPTRDPNAPALDIPAGVIPCRASDLEFAPGAGLSLLRFFNRSGRSCGLAGYVTVLGRVVTGQWQLVRTVPLDIAAVTAPRWTGEFEPSLTAVVSIRRAPAAECVDASAATHYNALRLALPGNAGTIDIDSIQFDAGDCPLQVTPFSGDSQDN
jgi:hypothetical protein